MSKNNTLCIAEWQSFGVEDIYRAIKPCHFRQSEVSKNSILCHTEGEARSISIKGNRDISLPLNMTENASVNVQNRLDISASAKPQYDNRDSSLHATHSAQNDKNSRDDDKLLDKAQKIFRELQNFANQKGNFDDRDGNHIFLTPYRNNRLKARNFVGLIQTKSGFCLEILPKTFRTAKDSEGFAIKNCVCLSQKSTHPLTPSATNLTFGEGGQEECQVCQAKQILLDMLRTLRSSPYKQSHISNLKIHRFPLLEVFAIMFLDEVERLIKRGIKSDYVVREENRTFLKGKLLFGENLKHNLAHKERFFTASDEFIADIAPNRLLVSTILFLSAQGFSPRTSGRISQARFIFADIGPSKSIDKDFALCPSSRHYKDYELLLAWCEIFLRCKSFMPYQGGDKAFALLFDMNKLFESFVAWHLKRACKNHIVKSQDGHKFLIKDDKFRIKPDLVIYRKNSIDSKNAKIIADTKWKILDSSKSNNYGIAQGDLYQIFAYLAKYQCAKGYLIYPKIIDNESIKHKSFTYKAQVCFYNQYNPAGYTEHNKQTMKLKIYFFDIKKPTKTDKGEHQ